MAANQTGDGTAVPSRRNVTSDTYFSLLLSGAVIVLSGWQDLKQQARFKLPCNY